MNQQIFTLTMSVGLLASSYGFSLPEKNRFLPPAPLAAGIDAAAYDFEGILELSNCSGSLVRFDDSNDADQALVLTNGHCVQMLDPGKVLINQKASRSFSVLDAKAAKIGTVRAQRLLYATMTKTDMALYQLVETYQNISSKYKIDPLTIAREAPSTGTDIEIISGYWKRGYSCSIEAQIYVLKEGGWSWQDSLRYSRPGCETIGGTSGSPVIATGTRTVVAINNTGNESGRKCDVNNPCEVDENGKITYQKGLSYAQQTYWLYSCRNDEGHLDLQKAGCLLPK